MSKEIGVIKEIDRLGRLVVPQEIRQRLGLEDKVELVLTAEGLLIRNVAYELLKRERP